MAMTTSLVTGPATAILPANAEGIAAAARCLMDGGLVALPTETVYGLGANATNTDAVLRLYQAKGRPSFNPLIAHVADLDAARAIADFDSVSLGLAQAFWPGPLTLVLPKTASCEVSDLATAGLDSIAVRVPAHPVARALLAAFGGPVVAPSANLSGHVSPTTAAHVAGDLSGLVDIILDGGDVTVGVESTIIDCRDQPTLLRPGGLARDAIEQMLGRPLSQRASASDETQPAAPGMLASHYAPRASVRLNAQAVEAGEALLAFGSDGIAGEPTVRLNLSPRGDLAEAAKNLFSHLRSLDAHQVAAIAVMPIPDEGLGEAINDRLRRAAAPRS